MFVRDAFGTLEVSGDTLDVEWVDNWISINDAMLDVTPP
jgi:hypothetical protein